MSIRAVDVVLGPVAAEGAVEQIVRRIGEAIGAGVLLPGHRLPPEPELAAQLGVAPMTLRHALAILREAGFIETHRGRSGGSFVRADASEALLRRDVAPPSKDALRDLTDWRRAVSGEAAALAARRAEVSDAELLDVLAAGVERSVRERREFRLYDARLHMAIAEVARSARLIRAEAEIQVELTEVLSFVAGPERALTASHGGHGPIARAIASGDETAARRAMIAHVESTYDWIVGLRLGLAGEVPERDSPDAP